MAISLFLTQDKQVLLGRRLPDCEVAHQHSSRKPRQTDHSHEKYSFTKQFAGSRRWPGACLICEHILASSRLEDDLAANLTDTSGCRVSGLPELAAVGIPNHVSKVGVVEDVEHLDAQVEGCSLGKLRVFLHTHICVDRSRPVEEVLLRAASHATNLKAAAEVAGKGRGVEEGVSGKTWIQLLQRTHLVRIVEVDVGQSSIAGTLKADWEAGVETADACDVPPVAVPVGTEETSKGKVPVVTGYKVMAQIPRRLAVVPGGIARIPKRTHVIQRFGIGVGKQVSDVASPPLCRNLQ